MGTTGGLGFTLGLLTVFLIRGPSLRGGLRDLSKGVILKVFENKVNPRSENFVCARVCVSKVF